MTLVVVMDFFDALVRYEVALWSVVDRELARQGLISLAQQHALGALDRHAGGARVQDLSDDIGITVGAASKLVDRLERDGLAVRSPNPANRRSSLIALTPAGRNALTSASQVRARVIARAVGPEDVGPLTDALQRLHTHLASSDLEAAG